MMGCKIDTSLVRTLITRALIVWNATISRILRNWSHLHNKAVQQRDLRMFGSDINLRNVRHQSKWRHFCVLTHFNLAPVQISSLYLVPRHACWNRRGISLQYINIINKKKIQNTYAFFLLVNHIILTSDYDVNFNQFQLFKFCIIDTL